MPPLRTILSQIENDLKERRSAKDNLYDAMRRATRMSKQAIFLVHRGLVDDAEGSLEEVRMLLAKVDEIAEAYQDLTRAGIVSAAFQEYAEARILLELTQTGEFVTPETIGVHQIPYILGLADVVGELRRRTLDSIKKNDMKIADESLEMMELIYSELLIMDEALHSVPELRRKSDIARRILEATRGDVTLEVRRCSLERSIKTLQKAMKSVRK